MDLNFTSKPSYSFTGKLIKSFDKFHIYAPSIHKFLFTFLLRFKHTNALKFFKLTNLRFHQKARSKDVIQTMAFQSQLPSYCVFQIHIVWLWNLLKCWVGTAKSYSQKHLNGAKFITDLQQCFKPVLCNLFWNEYCFSYKHNTTVKWKG